ncbi:hypothetical protein JZ751_020805, partial [Albula glossodonta]
MSGWSGSSTVSQREAEMESTVPLYTEVRQPNKLLKPRETLVRIFSRNKEVGAQPNKHFSTWPVPQDSRDSAGRLIFLASSYSDPAKRKWNCSRLMDLRSVRIVFLSRFSERRRTHPSWNSAVMEEPSSSPAFLPSRLRMAEEGHTLAGSLIRQEFEALPTAAFEAAYGVPAEMITAAIVDLTLVN